LKNADVVRVIANAAARGRRVSDCDACAFLGAKEILAKDAGNVNALAVVQNFMTFLETGVKPNSFAQFMLGDVFDTDEEIATRNQLQP
jgi:hypothetical protein